MVHSEWRSATLFRWVGYGLLILAFFDVVDILFPPQLMNPAWEFQAVGSLVERVPVPLIGLILVFFDGAVSRGRWEKWVLKLLSWAAVIVGILFLLLIPILIGDAVRLNNQNNVQVGAQVSQQSVQIQQLRNQLDQASSQNLEILYERLTTQGRAGTLGGPQDLKQQLTTEVAQAEQRLQAGAAAARENRAKNLFKSAGKWGLGALISGVLFIRIGQGTRWSRQKRSRRSPLSEIPST
jgi:hypothetical protein